MQQEYYLWLTKVGWGLLTGKGFEWNQTFSAFILTVCREKCG